MATTHSVQSNDRLLRNTLRANSIFSTVSGVAFIVAAGQIAAFLGLSADAAIIIALIGVGLLAFAAGVYWIGSRDTIDLNLATGILIGDVIWVAGSIFVLIADPFNFTSEGRWATLIIADAVGIFAVFEFVGLRRIRG